MFAAFFVLFMLQRRDNHCPCSDKYDAMEEYSHTMQQFLCFFPKLVNKF